MTRVASALSLGAGHALGEAAVLVEKVPDEQIEAEVEALRARAGDAPS